MAAVKAYVRRRVPPADQEDVVQTVFCDALAAADRPTDPVGLKRWILAIARRRVVDRHRAAAWEKPGDLSRLAEAPPPVEARAMVRWAERQASGKSDARTLSWMAREGEGEKLEAIAADEQLSAAQVRQRVSRMRRWMKERWAAELAAVAMLAVLAVAAWWLLRDRTEPPIAVPGPNPSITPEPPDTLDRARSLRADALRACDRGEWQVCLDGLDQARGLDPTGDQDPAVGAARAAALEALRQQQSPELKAPKSKLPPTSPTSAPVPKDVKPAPATPEPDEKNLDEKNYNEKPFEKKKGRVPSKAAPSDGSGMTPTGKSTGTVGGGGKPSPKKRAAKTVLDSPKYSD